MLAPQDFRSPFENLILSALPRGEYERLLPYAENVHLAQNKVLYEEGGHIRHVYFLKGGMASLVCVSHRGSTIEAGMIGNEGVVGLPAVLRASTAPYRVVMQLPGNASRIRADVVRAQFDRGGRLQDLLLRYVHVLLTQLAQAVACNRFHTAERRLCRWLLISRDRVNSDTLNLTQEFLSDMIGVPRTSVTAIAAALQCRGLIRYSRGKIQILDRPRMEVASCECYRIIRDDISRFLAA